MIITTSSGREVLIDDEDAGIVNQCRWSISSGYAVSYKKRKSVRMHRLIMNPPPNMEIDHIDGNKLNNSRSNLRVCTRAENGRNICKYQGPHHSKYKGVNWRSDKQKWESRIYSVQHKQRLGYYKSEAEAALAYNAKAIELYGKFAKLNEVP